MSWLRIDFIIITFTARSIRDSSRPRDERCAHVYPTGWLFPDTILIHFPPRVASLSPDCGLAFFDIRNHRGKNLMRPGILQFLRLLGGVRNGVGIDGTDPRKLEVEVWES